MREFIQRLLSTLYAYSYFRHIVYVNRYKENAGKMLVLSHRNGAIDGYVYHSVFRNVRFLLARQLQRNAVLRFLFPGIAVYRPKDKSNSAHENMTAVRTCISTLQNKQYRLGLFPEGTSQLGPKPLPYQMGYAKIAVMAAQENPFKVTPCAIFYDDPTCMGGQVFIVQAKSVSVLDNLSAQEIHQQVLASANQVLMSYETAENQLVAHQAAVMAMLSGQISYVEALYKIGENPMILAQARAYCKNPAVQSCLLYKKCPIFPRNFCISLWVVLITMPIVIPTFLFNIIPVLIGWLGGRFLADADNTVSLWRTLTGYSSGVLFYVILLFISPLMVLIGLPFSLWGFHLYGAFKKHIIPLINSTICPYGVKLYRKVQDEIMSKIM